MRGKNVFWGIVLLLGAAAMLLGRFGFLGGIGFWTIVFDIFLLAALVRGIARRGFGTILFSLAFLIIVNDELLGLEAITPWPVLAAALLGTIGLKLLFPGFGRHGFSHPKRRGMNRNNRIEQYDRDGGRVSCENVFGDATKYLSGVVSHVEIENVFGSTQVYFTEALLENHAATVQLESVFGSVVLYVPGAWQVLPNMETVFGRAEENGECDPYGEDVLHIEGSVVFGSLEIVYVDREDSGEKEAIEMREPDEL